MAANTSPIYPLKPAAFFTDLTAVTACTTRAPTATASLAAANIFVLVPVGASQTPTSADGTRIDVITVTGASSSITAPTAAQSVILWWWDGTKAWAIDEIPVTVVTPSAGGVVAFQASKTYTKLNVPTGHALYVSTTATTTASTTALVVSANGGTY